MEHESELFCSVVTEKISKNCIYSIHVANIQNHSGSGGGRVVKLLACEARGPGFDSRSRHSNFKDWLSSASKSRYGLNTAEAT